MLMFKGVWMWDTKKGKKLLQNYTGSYETNEPKSAEQPDIFYCNCLQIITGIFRSLMNLTTWLGVPKSLLKMGIRFFSHTSKIHFT